MAVCLCCDEKLNQGRNCTGKYCSNACKAVDVYNKYIQDWKAGKISGTTLAGASAHIRKYLFLKYASQCCECAWSEVNTLSGKVPLEVEHIDGDYTNNLEINLKLLCPNCHSLTHTYKALNRGKGRHLRVARYKEGKSY